MIRMKPNSRKIFEAALVFSLFLWITLCVSEKIEITRNYSESLPYHFAIVQKGKLPTKRDQVFLFYVRDNTILKIPKIKFLKRVGGLSGDEIEVNSDSRIVSVAGKMIGVAKPLSKKGQPLDVIQSDVIPQGKYFAYTPHPDSYDSRYHQIGLIDEKDIVGTVILAW